MAARFFSALRSQVIILLLCNNSQSSKIAKEGRKNGCGLIQETGRPGRFKNGVLLIIRLGWAKKGWRQAGQELNMDWMGSRWVKVVSKMCDLQPCSDDVCCRTKAKRGGTSHCYKRCRPS
ncbi:hypothetical protein F5Y11DRAFT_211860 [Daldinia sp. FL1419]|nr:hypothetical protein F5Y11DRAFT_211860 [Daldinia sp. FL1419]